MKYDVITITEVMMWPDDTNLDVERNNKSAEELARAISEGFEIYHAINFSADKASGIKYILRREINEK